MGWTSRRRWSPSLIGGWRRWRGLTALAVLVVVGPAGCVGLEPSATVTTLQPGYEQWFRLDWTLDQEASGAPRISGYIYNDYIFDAGRMRLLVQALDPAGGIVGQRLEWAHSVPALSRAYFEASRLPAADHYRVTVWTFEFLQGPSTSPFFRF
jgi:hypothetical protein